MIYIKNSLMNFELNNATEKYYYLFFNFNKLSTVL